MNALTQALSVTLLGMSLGNAMAADTPDVKPAVRAFLDQLNAGTGKPMEQLSPKDARAVLAGAQASVKLDLPKVDVAQKTITENGKKSA